MYKVKFDLKSDKWQERCQNPECRDKGYTLWGYRADAKKPYCKFCDTQLIGRDLMKWLYDRKRYFVAGTRVGVL